MDVVIERRAVGEGIFAIGAEGVFLWAKDMLDSAHRGHQRCLTYMRQRPLSLDNVAFSTSEPSVLLEMEGNGSPPGLSIWI